MESKLSLQEQNLKLLNSGRTSATSWLPCAAENSSMGYSPAVIAANTIGPCLVGHVGPVIRVETGRVFKALFFDVKSKTFLYCIELQGTSRYGKQFFANGEDTTNAKHCICDVAGMHIEHEFLDVAQAFTLRVINIFPTQGIGAH